MRANHRESGLCGGWGGEGRRSRQGPTPSFVGHGNATPPPWLLSRFLRSYELNFDFVTKLVSSHRCFAPSGGLSLLSASSPHGMSTHTLSPTLSFCDHAQSLSKETERLSVSHLLPQRLHSRDHLCFGDPCGEVRGGCPSHQWTSGKHVSHTYSHTLSFTHAIQAISHTQSHTHSLKLMFTSHQSASVLKYLGKRDRLPPPRTATMRYSSMEVNSEFLISSSSFSTIFCLKLISPPFLRPQGLSSTPPRARPSTRRSSFGSLLLIGACACVYGCACACACVCMGVRVYAWLISIAIV